MGHKSWYKFFHQRKYAEAFLEGEVLFRSLAYFRDFEDSINKQVIGDRFEGTRTGMPTGGVMLRGRSNGKAVKFEEPFAFNAIVNTKEIYVFCVSLSFNNSLAREFDAPVCIEITNKAAFFSRLKPALPPKAKLVSGPVTYYQHSSEDQLRSLLSASPEAIVKSKLDSFSYQDEYRFAFSTGSDLDVGSARLCLREFKPVPDPSEHQKELLQLGTLRDICKLYECGNATSA